MSVSIENKSAIARRLTISIPTELIEKEVEKRLDKTKSSAHIKGFRPGKAPLKLIKETYEGSIRFEVIDEQMRKSLGDAIEQQKLTLAGMPQINFTQIKEGEPVEFTADFDVYPEITLKGLEGVTIEKILPEINEKDVDETIEGIRKQHTHYEKIERPANMGDKVIIDFEGFIEGKPLENGKGKNTSLILGKQEFISGFEEGLVGAEIGKEITLNLSFPENYHHKDVAGKPVEFKVTVTEVQEPHLPALDEGFIKLFTLKENTLDAFRAEIRANMTREAKQVAKNKLRKSIYDTLAELNTVDIPQALIESDIDHLVEDAANEMKSWARNKSLSLPKPPRHIFAERARTRVKLGLLLKAVREQFNIELDQDRVQAAIEELAALYANPQEALQWIRHNENKMQEIENTVMEEQIFDKLLETANVVEKKESYLHLMKPEHEHGPDCHHDHE